MLPGPDPLKDRLGFIKPGQTARSDIVANLGAAPFVRRNERFFGYVAYKRDAGVVWLVSGVNGSGSGYVTTEWETATFVGIEFDDKGRVTRLDQAKTKSMGFESDRSPEHGHAPWLACLPTNVCLDIRRGGVLAPAAEDEEAKRFSGDPDRCSIYVVRTDDMQDTRLPLFRVRLDGRSAGETGPRTFFLWQAPPGKHEIGSQSVGPGDFTLGDYTARYGESRSSTVTFDCGAGDQLFFTQNESGALDPAAPAVGRADVMRAARMLSAF